MNTETLGNKIAFGYFIVTLAAFIILCICMGHLGWIWSKLFETTSDEMTGEVVWSLSRGMLTYIEQAATTDDATLRSILIDDGSLWLWGQIKNELPEIVEFGCINAIILRLPQTKMWAKLSAIAGGFLLQAIIAISWEAPVTFELFWEFMLDTWCRPVISILCIAAVVYALYQMLVKHSDDIGGIANKAVNVVMMLFVVVFKEAIQVILLVVLFDFIFLGGYAVTGSVGSILMKILTLLAPLGFMLLYRLFNPLMEKASNGILTHMLKDQAYEKTIAGELFCFVIMVLMLVSCFVLYFRLT